MFYVDTEKCNGCGACVAVCSQRAIALMGEKAIITHGLCRECGNCLEVCAASAIYEAVKEPQFLRIKRQAQVNAQEKEVSEMPFGRGWGGLGMGCGIGFGRVFGMGRGMSFGRGFGRGRGNPSFLPLLSLATAPLVGVWQRLHSRSAAVADLQPGQQLRLPSAICMVVTNYHASCKEVVEMPYRYGYGMGYGFRGASPPWPYVGRGSGGLPRCWYPGAYAAAPAYAPPLPPYYGGAWGAPYAKMTPEQELGFLKEEGNAVKAQLDEIEARIKELEKEQK